MTKNTRTRIILTAVAALLLVVMTVGGTLAYLVDTADEVKNTFTASNIKITLDETVPANNEAKMVPGNDIAKDPFVTLDSPSEKSYLYVEILEHNVENFLTYTVNSDWTIMTDVTGPNGGKMYYYKDAVEAGTTKYYILTGKTGTDSNNASLANGFVTVKNTVKDEDMNPTTGTFDKPTLSFYAYAIQSANTGTALEAWNLLKTQEGLN